MPFDLSLVKYIDVRTRNDYLQLGHIGRRVSECMRNDGLFTMGFLYCVECEMIINLSSLSEKWRGLANVC